MNNRNFLAREIDTRGGCSARALALCRAIIEDAEDARQYRFQGRGALELHSVLPSGPAEIRHASAPLPSELTSLID